MTIWNKIHEADWAELDTAYGAAEDVPDQLEALRSASDEEALRAAGKLSGGLCHQGAFVSSAALPALPFILDALEECSAGVQQELLNMLVGMADCTGPDAVDPWEHQLGKELRRSTAPIQKLLESSSQEVRQGAEQLMALLRPQDQASETPSPTNDFEELLLAALEQAITALVGSEAVELEAETRPVLLAELLDAALEARNPKAMIEALIKTLIDSDHVLEVYATDDQLAAGFQRALS